MISVCSLVCFCITITYSVPAVIPRFNFDRYQRYEEIKTFFNDIQTNYKQVIVEKGYSYDDRPILLVKVSSDPDAKRPIIFLEGGSHAREWVTPAFIAYVLTQLLEQPDLLRLVDWYMIPVLNPDGYEFSFTYDRSWRKTKSYYIACEGVDPNRNFDFHWLYKPVTQCGEDFPGSKPFSEPETQFLRDTILKYSHRIKLFISIHCCAQIILLPWAYTTAPPSNIKELRHIATEVQIAMKNNGSTYGIGTPAEMLYAAFGTSYDWVKGVGGVDLSFAIELSGEYRSYKVSEEQILPTCTEGFRGIQVFHKYIEKKILDGR